MMEQTNDRTRFDAEANRRPVVLSFGGTMVMSRRSRLRVPRLECGATRTGQIRAAIGALWSARYQMPAMFTLVSIGVSSRHFAASRPFKLALPIAFCCVSPVAMGGPMEFMMTTMQSPETVAACIAEAWGKETLAAVALRTQSGWLVTTGPINRVDGVVIITPVSENTSEVRLTSSRFWFAQMHHLPAVRSCADQTFKGSQPSFF